jgi:hypothetical protein
MYPLWPGVWPFSGTAVTPVAIGRDLLSRGLEIELPLALGGARHGRVIVPVSRVVFMHNHLGVGKQPLPARRVGQACRMVWVHVSEQNQLDICGIDAGGGQVAVKLARGGQQVIA